MLTEYSIRLAELKCYVLLSVSPHVHRTSCHIPEPIEYDRCYVILRAIDRYIRHMFFEIEPEKQLFCKQVWYNNLLLV